jgi:hypothetical protein
VISRRASDERAGGRADGRVRPTARDELAEAVAYYDAERAGLGDEFLREAKRTVTRIRDFPDAWPKMSRRSRRCRMTRFPYGLVYQVKSNEIRILAVAHLRRRQYYWRGRE